MAIYLLNFSSIFIYWLLFREFNHKYRTSKGILVFFLIIITIQLVLIMGLRNRCVGWDTGTYVRIFEKYRTYSLHEILNDDRFEFCYLLLIKIVSLFTDNFTWFTLVVAVLSIIPIIVAVSKCSAMPFLSIALFIAFDYYAFMFSGMRQGIAFAFCVLSVLCIRKKRFGAFLIVILFAAQFHKSAYLFLPAYFLADLKINKISITCMIIIFGVVFVFKEQLYDLIATNLYNTNDNRYARKETGAFLWMMMILLICIVVLIFKDGALNKDKSFNIFIALLCVGATLSMFTMVGNNAKRIVEYYCIFMIFAIPGILNGIGNSKIKNIATFATVIACTCMFLYFLNVDGYGIVPYL